MSENTENSETRLTLTSGNSMLDLKTGSKVSSKVKQTTQSSSQKKQMGKLMAFKSLAYRKALHRQYERKLRGLLIHIPSKYPRMHRWTEQNMSEKQ